MAVEISGRDDVRVSIQLFALARERAGRSVWDLELPQAATVADLKTALGATCPALASLVPNLRIAINAEYALDDQPIPPGAELAAIPPVSGGGNQR
jgi:molybdopterin converting factor small subunit